MASPEVRAEGLATRHGGPPGISAPLGRGILTLIPHTLPGTLGEDRCQLFGIRADLRPRHMDVSYHWRRVGPEPVDLFAPTRVNRLMIWPNRCGLGGVTPSMPKGSLWPWMRPLLLGFGSCRQMDVIRILGLTEDDNESYSYRI